MLNPNEAHTMARDAFSKMLTPEKVLSGILFLLVMGFAGGSAYNALAKDNELLKTRVIAIETQQSDQSKVTRQMEVNQAVIMNDQQHMKKDLSSARRDIRDILSIVRRMGPAHSDAP